MADLRVMTANRGRLHTGRTPTELRDEPLVIVGGDFAGINAVIQGLTFAMVDKRGNLFQPLLSGRDGTVSRGDVATLV